MKRWTCIKKDTHNSLSTSYQDSIFQGETPHKSPGACCDFSRHYSGQKKQGDTAQQRTGQHQHWQQKELGSTSTGSSLQQGGAPSCIHLLLLSRLSPTFCSTGITPSNLTNYVPIVSISSNPHIQRLSLSFKLTQAKRPTSVRL